MQQMNEKITITNGFGWRCDWFETDKRFQYDEMMLLTNTKKIHKKKEEDQSHGTTCLEVSD